MAITSPHFASEYETLAAWAKALAHPARIAILEVLARRNACVCGEIVDELPLAQSTVSQHLKVLKDAGIITGRIDGPRSCYCLDQDAVRRVRAALDQLMERLQGADGCCG
jgi:ArsR family transcriptional regulator